MAEFEKVAKPLLRNWPDADGEGETLGPYLAYPKGQPTELLLLGSLPEVVEGISIASVTRSSTGALRFQLSGSEPDAWVEWHPRGSAPSSFLSGLQTHYRLSRSSQLEAGWYGACYETE